MKECISVLTECALFTGLTPPQIEEVVSCLMPVISHYEKGEMLILCGGTISQVGIILAGSAQVIKQDAFGNQSVVTKLFPSDLFAETFVGADVSTSPVSVMATSDCTALFLNYNKIITVCEKTCHFHQTLVGNMVRILAMKNLNLNQKIEILSQKTIREKLLTYFRYEALRASSNQFEISFSRQELADFLCVDRSALSRELSNMKKAQILTYEQNRFEIY